MHVHMHMQYNETLKSQVWLNILKIDITWERSRCRLGKVWFREMQ